MLRVREKRMNGLAELLDDVLLKEEEENGRTYERRRVRSDQ